MMLFDTEPLTMPPVEDLTTVENQTELFLTRWVFAFKRDAARRELAQLLAMTQGEWWPSRPVGDYDGKQLAAVDVTWLCCRRTVTTTNVAMGCARCQRISVLNK